MKKVFTLVFAALVFISCNKNSTSLGDEKAGKDIVGWYYYNVMQDAYDSIPKLMNEDFYTSQQQADFINTLKVRDSTYGNITSFTLDKWEVTNDDKKTKTKEFYSEYKVKYQNNSDLVVEKIYLTKKGNELKISKFELGN